MPSANCAGGPSFHVVLFYGFLRYLLAHYTHNRSLIRTIWALVIVYLLFSGLWLGYYGRHWFTDVIGGYIYWAFYLLVLIATYRWA